MNAPYSTWRKKDEVRQFQNATVAMFRSANWLSIFSVGACLRRSRNERFWAVFFLLLRVACTDSVGLSRSADQHRLCFPFRMFCRQNEWLLGLVFFVTLPKEDAFNFHYHVYVIAEKNTRPLAKYESTYVVIVLDSTKKPTNNDN